MGRPESETKGRSDFVMGKAHTHTHTQKLICDFYYEEVLMEIISFLLK